MQEELSNVIKKIKLLIETDRNLGVSEYFLVKGNVIDNNAKSMQKATRLNELRKRVLECKRCPLYKSRTNLVFGEGDPNADLMFIGEAPGQEEDLQGRPFVGRAGMLLSRIIKAMGLRREEVYIANILKDRPPNNRNPKEDEIKACIGYLLEQIEIIRPRVICALGSFAAKELLKEERSISQIRGKFYNFKDIKLMPTYHPAYLLRNPQDKRLVWEDMKKIMRELGIKNKR